VSDLGDTFRTFVMIGIVIVFGTSQFHRGVGASLGIAFWVATAVLGHLMYVRGGAIGFPGFPLSEPVFLAICAVFLVLQVIGLRAYLGARKRRRAIRDELTSEEE